MTALVFQQMAKVVADLSHIPKQRSQGVSYEFRGIDAVMNALHGPFAEHGLFMAPRVLDDWQLNMIPGSNNRVQAQALFRVAVDIYATDGSCVTLGPGLAQSHDYGDKAVYQAQQNAIKYLLLEAFCIPTSEQDMDARESDPVPASGAVPPAVPDAPPADQDQLDTIKQLRDSLPEARQKAFDGWFNRVVGDRKPSTIEADQAIAALTRAHKQMADEATQEAAA